MCEPPDFLDELIAGRTARNRAFPSMVAAALQQRTLLRELTGHRIALGLSQTEVAARMGASRSAVARLERGEADARLSTLDRYSAALGKRLDWRLKDAEADEASPEERVHATG